MGNQKRRSKEGRESTDLDIAMMRRAIARARRAEGRVEPNPMVGCVITKNDRIIGEGHHRKFGGPHAEVHALNSCTTSPHGATVYVTLEPCAHHGKTPPCLDALLEAKVGRVVIGVLDPYSEVAGKSVRRLRAAGADVTVGVCKDEAVELAAPYLTRTNLKRPFVIAKWAQTLDGKLATYHGDSKWISGEASRRMVHHLRARVDAVLVGINTVLADDPQLTARDVPIKRVAHRIVLDAHLQIPLASKLVRTATDTPTLVMTARDHADSPKARRLKKHGVEIIAVPTRNDRLSLKACLTALHRLDMTNVLVEAGAGLLHAFLKAGLVDEALVFTAPIMLGDERVAGTLRGRRTKRISEAVRPRVIEIQRVGDDVLHRLRFS